MIMLYVAQGKISDERADALARDFVGKTVGGGLFDALVNGSREFEGRDGAPYTPDEAVDLLCGLILNGAAREARVFRKWLGSNDDGRLTAPIAEFLEAIRAEDRAVAPDRGERSR